MRTQYPKVSWKVAQNFIMGKKSDKIENSFNIYQVISEADSPASLLSTLSEKVKPITENQRRDQKKGWVYPEEKLANLDGTQEDADQNVIYQNYLHWFKEYNFLVVDNDE
jgi:hypothetical protein